MITKYKQYNESIKSLLVGPSKEEVWKNLGYDITFDTPEEFISYVLGNIKIKKETKHSIFWGNENGVIFEQDLIHKKIWVDFKLLWSLLHEIFNIDYKKMHSFINLSFTKNKIWTEFTPSVKVGLDRDYKDKWKYSE